MALAEDLQAHRAERVAALGKSWTGPATYDPYHYFSVFFPNHLFALTCSRVFFVPFIVVMSITVVWVALVQILFACNTPPCSGILSNLASFTSFFALYQVTLALLLSFRLARCAVRFYDARAACGKLVEICRTLASEVLVYCAHNAALQDDLLRWTVAMPVATKNFLRGEKGAVAELSGVLSTEEAEAMMAAPHQPLFVLDILRSYAFRMATSHPAEPAVVAMAFRGVTDSINTLNGAMGALERIGNTPLPLAYMVYTRGYIVLYLILVIFLLGHTWGWYTILIMALLSWLLIGLEAAATECERPVLSRLNHLPLERYCVVVADNIHQIASTLSHGPAQMPWDRPPESPTFSKEESQFPDDHNLVPGKSPEFGAPALTVLTQ